MKLLKIATLTGCLLVALPGLAQDCEELQGKTSATLLGERLDLCKAVTEPAVVVVANTASQCGFVGQLEELQTLHRQYAEQGLLVVGIPTGDFGGQEFGDNKEIAKFCRMNYGVEFAMLPKSCVRCDNPHPLFAFLQSRGGKSPRWNFHKYVYNVNTGEVANFGAMRSPLGGKMEKTIRAWLEQ